MGQLMTSETRHRHWLSRPEQIKRRTETGNDAAAFFKNTDCDARWAALMARAQDGDAAAYLQLLNEITPYTRSLAANRHKGRLETEEAVQDILLTLHSIRRTYDPSRSFAAWLAGIAASRASRSSPHQEHRCARDLPIGAKHDVLPATE
jgi:hypothetical protein